MANAVVLLSGGLDSATVLAMGVAEGLDCYALSFRYGQRHDVELAAAARVAAHLGAASHRIVDLDLRLGPKTGFGLGARGSALTDVSLAVPKDRPLGEITGGGEIPITYVPARNTIFLAYGLALCEAYEADDLFIGANELDASGYPDCRPAFLAAFEAAARLGTRRTALRVRAPLLGLRKAEIIRAGIALGVDYSLTHSCYDPAAAPPGDSSHADNAIALACGGCDACILRRQGFFGAGVADPTRYR